MLSLHGHDVTRYIVQHASHSYTFKVPRVDTGHDVGSLTGRLSSVSKYLLILRLVSGFPVYNHLRFVALVVLMDAFLLHFWGLG